MTTLRDAGLPQTEAEPVAWMYTGIGYDGTPHQRPSLVFRPEYMDCMSASKGAKAVPLYAHPPRGCAGCGAGADDNADGLTALYCVKCGERANPREWQGLTDEEISDLVRDAMRGILRDAVRGTLLNRGGGTSGRIARAIEQALRERNA